MVKYSQKSSKKKLGKPKGVLTETDVDVLITRMHGVFATSEDHVNLEDKVDKLTELVEQLPTRDEMEKMLDRAFGLTKLKTEHDKMKKIFREKFNIDIEVEA